MKKRWAFLLALIFALALLFAACGENTSEQLADGDTENETDDADNGKNTDPNDNLPDDVGGIDVPDNYWDDENPPEEDYWDDKTSGDPYGGDSDLAETGAPTDDGGGYADGDAGGDPGGSGGNDEIPAGQMTAGEWRDLDHWGWWLDLLDNQEWGQTITSWGFDTTGRIRVKVLSGQSAAVDVQVALLDGAGELCWLSRTNNLGEAELFAGMFKEVEGPFEIVAANGEETATLADVEAGTDEQFTLTLDAAPNPPFTLDLMFVIDATGSMGDEINYLQAELSDVITRAMSSLDQEMLIRTSVNFYRDAGDAFIVDSNPFTETTEDAIEDLMSQEASGGGDYPEALDYALDDGVLAHEWSAHAKARLMFVLLDAPPHEDESILYSLHASAARASEKGIRMIPVSASGIDKPTEMLLRQLAIATAGTYTFITDHSGIGGGHLDPNPTIGEHEVEFLNDLMVRLITEAME